MHLHRTPQTCDTCAPWPDWARHIASHLNYLNELMENMMTDQDKLDTDVAALTSGVAAVEAEIAALKAQPAAAALDFTALDAVTAKLTADTAPAAPTAPADVPPAQVSANAQPTA